MLIATKILSACRSLLAYCPHDPAVGQGWVNLSGLPCRESMLTLSSCCFLLKMFTILHWIIYSTFFSCHKVWHKTVQFTIFSYHSFPCDSNLLAHLLFSPKLKHSKSVTIIANSFTTLSSIQLALEMWPHLNQQVISLTLVIWLLISGSIFVAFSILSPSSSV